MKPNYGPGTKYRTEQEWIAAYNKQVEIIMGNLRITREDANKRLNALLESGILSYFHPDNPLLHAAVDTFLTSPTWTSQPEKN